MSAGSLIWLRTLAGGVLLLVWAFAAHLASLGALPDPAAIALGLLPFALAIGLLPARVDTIPLRLPVSVLAVALVAVLWPRLAAHVSLLYYLEHLGIHLALAALFGRTLFGSGDALVTRFARALQPGRPLSRANLRYTRQVTVGWTLFFVANATVSTLLYLLTPWSQWSLYANLLTGPLVALVFVIEYFIRRQILPADERPGFVDAIRAYRQHSASRAPGTHCPHE